MIVSPRYFTSTFFIIKPLSVLDWTVNFWLTLPLFSMFIPRFVRHVVNNAVAIIKAYYLGFVCSLRQLLFWKHLTVSKPTFRYGNRLPLAIVTGGTSGIGLALCELLAPNWRLIIIGRDRHNGHVAIGRIKRKCGRHCKIMFYAADLSSRRSINEFLEIFMKSFDRLHLLVNNASVMMAPYETVGASGDIEMHWAVNFLAPVYLADRLTPCLQRGLLQDGFSRVVNISSAAFYGATLSPEYVLRAGGCNGLGAGAYSSQLAYSNSKLALSLYTQEQAIDSADRNTKITTCSVHPGIVATNLFRHTNILVRWVTSGLCPFIPRRLILTPEEAASSVLWTCFSSDVESGAYYDNGIRCPLPFVEDTVKAAMRMHLEKQDIITSARNEESEEAQCKDGNNGLPMSQNRSRGSDRP